MDKKLQAKVDAVQAILDGVASDKKVTRTEYREFLEEVQSGIDASLGALNEDDRRDARG